jgi:HlyD family secretion protein
MDQILAWLTALLAFIPGLGPTPEPSWAGYAEIDYVYVAAAGAGTIADIAVTEGQIVAKGDVLFALEASQQQAQYDAALARAKAAAASLDNLRTGGRAAEIDVIRASLSKAEADLALAQQNLARTQQLFDQGLVPQAQLDQARAAATSAAAAVEQLRAQLAVAELPARDAQQIAAEASLMAAEADAAAARAALELRTVTAPEDGHVERLFFKAGEVAGAGVPVLSLSGAGPMRIRFYVGEAERQGFHLGQVVAVSCDGCAASLTATIDRFDADPQFTPPIIYSRDERSRLVFLTEAALQDGAAIHPGQPVSVELLP